ncbi:hypothetical protein TSAR_008402 [Trichomalopsis sarcophagae]|uniref:Uncharacterized protein n=1 Tax=Trichomalopsis sarcophagae TaxID=543379 RepID=A0A232EG09_9HYME|nr:hypothetical protein TSAR_008402 [Trichomalopsis sarcophagae]
MDERRHRGPPSWAAVVLLLLLLVGASVAGTLEKLHEGGMPKSGQLITNYLATLGHPTLGIRVQEAKIHRKILGDLLAIQVRRKMLSP